MASSSGSYSFAAHAPTRIQFVKLGGASSGSLLSPARKLLKLSFAGSGFIPYGKMPAAADFHIGAATVPGLPASDKTYIETLRSAARNVFRVASFRPQLLAPKAQLIIAAWGNAPGLPNYKESSAESAIQFVGRRMLDSRFQRLCFAQFESWGVAPG